MTAPPRRTAVPRPVASAGTTPRSFSGGRCPQPGAAGGGATITGAPGKRTTPNARSLEPHGKAA